MREIKFRAKALTGGLIHFSLYDVTNYFPGDGVFYVGGTPCEVGSEQEYTGLKDKNGKEIYEGDIIRYKESSGNVTEIYPVEWEDGCFTVYNPFAGDEGDCARTLIKNNDTVEVIGDIYSNPELLKEGS